MAAPLGEIWRLPDRTPLSGLPTGGSAVGAAASGGVESRLTLRPSGRIASLVPSPTATVVRVVELGVAWTVCVPTRHVSDEPVRVTTNGACVADTKVCGGVALGEAIKALLASSRALAWPYG